MQSLYLKKFENLKKDAPNSFILRGSTLIVEVLPEEEKVTKGGLIIATDIQQAKGGINEHKLLQGICVASGEGYIDSEGKSTPCDIQPGDIVILPKYGVTYVSTFPGLNEITKLRLGMIRENDVLGYFRGEEGFNKAKEILND